MRLTAPPLVLFGLQLALVHAVACRSRPEAVPNPPGAIDAGVASSVGAAASLDANECRRLEDDAHRDVLTAYERANKDCKTVDDCTVAPLRGCVSDCANGGVSKSTADAWSRERERVDVTCKKFWNGECAAKLAIPLPSCQPVQASCDRGKCNATSFVPDAAPPPSAALGASDCRRLYDQAQIEAKAAYDRASKACKTHDDCALASRRGCVSDCGSAAVAKSAYDAWKRDSDRLGATTCKKFWDNDCMAKVPIPTPTCPIYWPTCEAGKCIAGHARPTQ